jgi:HAD superfamily hydrolase (TIGR01509 family)
MSGSPFQLVILDNDGVLVDSEPHANRVLADLLTGYGLPTTYEECVAEFVGASMGRVRLVVEARLGSALPEDFEAEYHRRLFRLVERELQPVDGVRDALDSINVPKCVASSGTHERIRRTLEAVDLWEEFGGAVFSSEDVERGKPAPDLFLYAADAMGVSAGRCAVVDDSPLGIEAANAAGMTSFGFASRTPKEQLAAASGGVFDRMAELPNLLRMPDARIVRGE